MKKAILLFGILILIVAIIIFKMNNISKSKLVVKLNDNIDFVESNKILITHNSKDIAFDFIKALKKKKKFFDSYNIFLTKKESLQISFLTGIQTSKGAFKYFNQYSKDYELLDAIKIGKGKQFYECVKICLGKQFLGNKMCSCSAYFIGY
jgi:hypothetical protein